MEPSYNLPFFCTAILRLSPSPEGVFIIFLFIYFFIFNYYSINPLCADAEALAQALGDRGKRKRAYESKPLKKLCCYIINITAYPGQVRYGDDDYVCD